VTAQISCIVINQGARQQYRLDLAMSGITQPCHEHIEIPTIRHHRRQRIITAIEPRQETIDMIDQAHKTKQVTKV
jgi:hypothetical protein